MSARKLFVEVIINTRKAASNVKLLRGSVNLLKSTLVALFRTGSIALIFTGIRGVLTSINSLKEGIKTTTEELIKLNTQGIKTATILTKGGSNTGFVYEQVSEMARKASTQVGYTAREIQGGLTTAALAGSTLAESLGLTEASMKMATLGGTDFNSTIDGLIGVSRVFGVETEAIPKLADTITASFTSAKMTLDGFFTAISYAAPVAATAFGSSERTIRDVAAALMTLTDKGLTASKAGIYLRGTINKLGSGTSKAATMFAHYDVNIYKADAKNQRFLQTLLKSQKGMSKYYEQLDKLKNTQYDLAAAGEAGGSAYEANGKQIDALLTRLGGLEKGTARIFKQFTLAGGKMKPLSEVLELMSEIPTEVVTRTFGVRGGTGYAVVGAKPEDYKEKLAILDSSMKASDEGESILQRMFDKVVNTFAVTWKKLMNTVTAGLQIVFDPFINVANELFKTLHMGFAEFYKSLENNKGVFKMWAVSIGDALLPAFTGAAMAVTNLGNKVGKTFMPGVKTKFQMYKFDKESGEVKATETKAASSVGGKIKLFVKSAVSLFIAYLEAGMATLKPVLNVLAGVFIDAMIAQFKAKISIFKEMFGSMFKYAMDEAIAMWNNRDKGVYKTPGGDVRVNEAKLKEMSKLSWQDFVPILSTMRSSERGSQAALLKSRGNIPQTQDPSGKTVTTAGIIGGKGHDATSAISALFYKKAEEKKPGNLPPLPNDSKGSVQFGNEAPQAMEDILKGSGNTVQFGNEAPMALKAFSESVKSVANSMTYYAADGTKQTITLADIMKRNKLSADNTKAELAAIKRDMDSRSRIGGE